MHTSESHTIKNAVIMAAGLGMRMRPLTQTVPKPLIKIGDKRLIDTVIEGLLYAEVENINIVTGHLASQFEQLKSDYPNVNLIYNPEYNKKNNISSIFAARDVLRGCNSYICEADLFISDKTIFSSAAEKSAYYGIFRDGYSSDWVFKTDDSGRICEIGMRGTDLFNMAGVSVWLQSDMSVILDNIEKMMKFPECGQKFWDEAVNEKLADIDVRIKQVTETQIVEIDTLEEYYSFANHASLLK